MIRKFAAFEVLEATLAPAHDPLGLQAYAHRHSFTYSPRPGYLYIRSRAISSRTNDNFDTFPAEEIEKSYMTFIGKPVFVNHNNDNHRRARGVIIDAALHRDRNPDGSPDTWSEVLMEVDAIRFPKLAQAVIDGHIDRTSMGTDVAYSLCSFCGNKATTPLEYCKHIPKMKGQRIYRTTASGKKEGVLVSEICHGLKFFENSLLVEEPADPTAFFTGVDDHSGMGRKASKTAGYGSMDQCDCPGSKKIEPHTNGQHFDWATRAHAEGRTDAWGHPVKQPYDGHGAFDCNNYKCTEHPKSLYQNERGAAPVGMPGWLKHDTDPHKDVAREVGKAFHETGQTEDARYLLDQNRQGPSKYSSLQKEAPGKFPTEHHPVVSQDEQGNFVPGCSVCGPTGEHVGSDRTLAHLQSVLHTNQVAWSRGLDTGAMGTPEYGDKKPVEPPRTPKGTHNAPQYELSGEPSNWRLAGVNPAGIPQDESTPSGGDTTVCATCGKPIYQVNDGNMGWQHDVQGAAGVPHQAIPKTASIYLEAKERKRVSEMSEAEEQAFRRHQESGRRWNRQNPAHADNIIAHWNAATPHERHAGMNWYADAHETTKHIARDTGHPMHVAAGMMANYSPQTHWATNMLNAAKALRGKKGIGGAGSGVFASDDQRKVANRLMGTEGHKKQHYDHVFTGPKTHAFAHLIEHGGNANPSNPKVVVDRHALSVACGKRAKDIDYEMSGLSGKKRYKQVADEYHKAAQHISKHTGVKVEAHQVQAATWLVRQRLNAGEDKKMASYGKIGNDAKTKWDEYAGEHHPLAMGKEPGTGYHLPKDAPEDVQHSQALHDEGGHGSLHSAVPASSPRRKSRVNFGHTASLEAHVPSTMVYLAYGETMAPEDVDTLRDEECPVCGESDAYDGNRCDVCGFDAPPKMFQDPDLDLAKQLDLRKDIGQDMATDPNGDGMPDVIPGSGGLGPDAIPPNADMVPDPDDVAQQQMNEIGESQAPLQPEQLDENGQPVANPDPLAQDMPMDPNALPMDPEDIAGADPMDNAGEVEPGTPGDAAADLMCPACGYQQGAEPPQSVDMDAPPESVAGAEGALCPNCQQAPLMSIQDIDSQQQQMGQNPVPVGRAASLAFPIYTL